MWDKAKELGAGILPSWGSVNKITSAISNNLPSKETVSKGASIAKDTVYYSGVTYGRLVADMFVVKEAMNFLFASKEDEEKVELDWTDIIGMFLATISSTYLMLTVYNIRRKHAQHQSLETPEHSPYWSKIAKSIGEFVAMVPPLALVAYGGSYFFVQDFITRNQIAVQSVSVPAGGAVGYDNYVLHDAHHDGAEESTYKLFKELKFWVKVWFIIQAISLLVGHGAEAYLQSEGGMRAATDNTDAEWAHYLRPILSVILSIPVIYFATNTELHSILTQDSKKPTYFLVKLLGWIASIVHTAGPAVGILEFISAVKCGWDTSWGDLTPECDSSLVYILGFWSKVGLLGLGVGGVGLMGGIGFRAATINAVNEVVEDAVPVVKEKAANLRMRFFSGKQEESLLGRENKASYGTDGHTNGANSNDITIGMASSN